MGNVEKVTYKEFYCRLIPVLIWDEQLQTAKSKTAVDFCRIKINNSLEENNIVNLRTMNGKYFPQKLTEIMKKVYCNEECWETLETIAKKYNID